MTEAINGVRFRQPDDVHGQMTAVLRVGARQSLAQAVEWEAEAFLASQEGLRPPGGRARGPRRTVAYRADGLQARHGHRQDMEAAEGRGPVAQAPRRVRFQDRTEVAQPASTHAA